MRRVLCLIAVLLLASPLVAADKPFFFQKDDRVVFLGDSITEQYQYSTYMELYLTTRFPEWKIFFLNAGISGDTANGGASRFQKHVLDEMPTAVTIDFGMNDGGYGAFNEQRNGAYAKKTLEMVEAAKKAGVRVALISPNAVDPRKKENLKLYLETQKQFYAPLKEIAEKNGIPFVDQYAITREVVEKIIKDEAKLANPFPDGVHTSPGGGLLMANTILVGLGAPAKVSDVVIEGSKVQTERCKVEKLEVADGKITFTRTDEAIPLPIQKEWVSMLPYVNDLKDLNWYGLTVKGLGRGNYTVSVDGKEIGKFTHDEMSKGVNLGNLMTGPIYEHSQKVFTAINQKNEINKKRFRGGILSKKIEPAEIAKLLEQIKEQQAQVYKLLEPKTYSFEIKPAS